MEYINFEIEIDPGYGQEYPVRVSHSPAGEAREVMSFPFDKLALESRLKDLQISLLNSAGLVRRGRVTPYEETVQRFGVEMFSALFVGEIRSRYDVCQELASQQGKGIRIRLCIHPPELAILPWEFIFDTRIGDYVCLSRDTSIVRYIELPHSTQSLAVTPPLEILGMIVSPTDLPSLDVETEKQRIERALQPLRQSGLVNITWLKGQTWRDLRTALLTRSWHIFHFVGHGGFDAQQDEGLIALANPEGQARYFTATEFGRLLSDHRTLRLVVLNACKGAHGGLNDTFSGTATTLIQRGVPAVIAMQFDISDVAAIEFANTFYKTLVLGAPVDVALSEARKSLSFELKNCLEWGVPVLYMRSAEGSIFTVEGRKVPSAKRKRAPNIWHWVTELPYRHLLATTRSLIVPLLLLLIVVAAFRYLTTLNRPDPSPSKPVISTQKRTNHREGKDAKYVFIPGGKFMMGTNDGEFYEGKEHVVDLPEFWIKQTEVTNHEFSSCIAAGPCASWTTNNWQNQVATYPDYPVTNVNWELANIYASWAGGRLPNEAEWEKACRGVDGRIYPWGNDLPFDEYGRLPDFSLGSVSQFPEYASPYGVQDLIGNVEEWTSSLWGNDVITPKYDYPYDSLDGREERKIDPSSYRVLRGDYKLSTEDTSSGRCTRRYRDNWFNSNIYYGFRVVLESDFSW